MTIELPPDIAELVDAIAAVPGAVAVALGGSRAMGTADAESDWDLALYYRGALDVAALERWGTVYPPGSWGRIMNGGAWLRFGEKKVDVLLRDLDVAEQWSERAERGEYEVDALLGYLAGVPTYSLRAELALGVPLRGSLPPVGAFPPPLAEVATRRWRFSRDFTFEQARSRATRGDIIGAVGQAAKAAVEAAHARLCERREWVLNEKRIVERAGFGRAQNFFAAAPREADALLNWLARVETTLSENT